LFLALLLASSCAFLGGSNRNAAAYIQATNTYEADGTAYEGATKTLKAALAAGQLPDDQRQEWNADKVAVRDADDVVYDDFQQWKQPPFNKPAAFDQHYAALKTAMRRVLRLARDAGGGR
jgi:hypothetical protein